MTELYKLFQEMLDERGEIPTHRDDRVLIVDALNTYIRCFAAVPTMNEDGEHIGGISGFLKSIGVAIRKFKPSRCILAFDGKGGSQRRRKLYPDYKCQRKAMTRLNRTYNFRDREEEQEAMKFQLYTLGEILQCLPVTVLVPPKVEADDVIAYLAQLFEERGGRSIIMSTDKDFLQLVNDKTDLWNPVKKKIYDTAAVVEEYGIHPTNFVYFRIMDGDKSDNIPGIKGAGKKVLLKSYPQLSNPNSMSMDKIISYAIQQEKGKLFEKIRTNRDLLERNYKLMNLSEVQMSGETKLNIIKKADDDELELKKTDLTNLLIKHKMLNTLGNYDQWILTTFQPLMRFTK